MKKNYTTPRQNDVRLFKLNFIKGLFSLLILMSFNIGLSQNAGFFGTPLSSVIYNDGSSQDQTADIFNGSNLGSITTLTLNGARIQTFKNNGGNVTGAFLNYRIYETGSATPPSFTEQSIGFLSDDGGGNQTWETSNLNIDLYSGLTPGDYKFEVFFKITTNIGDIFQSDNGNNYTADFSVPFRTTQSGPWNSGTTWVGGVVPPSSGSNVSIEHNVNLDISTTSVASVQIASGTTFTVDVGNILTSNGGGITGDGSFTVNGTWRIEAGGFTNIAPTYGSSSTLIYANGSNYGRGTEWSATTGAGYPHNVTISNNTTLELGANGGTGTARQCAGNLTVDANSTLTLNSPAMSAALTVVGKYTNNGTTTLSTSSGGDLRLQGDFDDNETFNANGRAVFFNGGNTQNIDSTSDPLEIDVMRINKTGGEVVMNQNLLVDETGDPIQFNSATSVLNLNEFNLTIGKPGVASAITMTAGSTFKGGSDSNLTILGNGAFGNIVFDPTDNTLASITVDRQSTGSVGLGSDLVVTVVSLTNGDLDLNGNKLSISGANAISGPGTIIASGTDSTLEFTNTLARTIENADIQNNIVENLTFSGTGGVTINTDITVAGTFDINAGENTISSGSVLNLNTATLDVAPTASLIFESDDTSSAQLDDATGSTVTGDITVQRYTSAKRGFRFITSPVSGQSVNAAWQEGGNSPTGFGTHITGQVGTVGTINANGLDETLSGAASMFTFNNTYDDPDHPSPNSTIDQSGAYAAVLNTNSTTLNAGDAYALFKRGDRNIVLTDNTAFGETTLRATGTMFTGSMTLDTDPLTASHAGAGNAQELSNQDEYYNLIANPYQAVVDFNAVTKSGITDFIYVRDATLGTLGGWVTVQISNNSIFDQDPASPISQANNRIPAGMAFFVQNDNSSPASRSITFEESDKATSQAQTAVFNEVTMFYINSALYISSDLQNGDTPVDGFGLRFDSQFTTPGSLEDGNKLQNDNENIAVVNNGLKYLDFQNIPSVGHVVQLHTSGYSDSNYSLVMTMENVPDGMGVFINDAYLGTQTEITDGFVFDFTVDANIPESIAEDRFSLVFDNTTLGVEDNSFGAGFSLYPNPTRDGNFSIATTDVTGDVTIEITNVLGQVVFKEQQALMGNEVQVNSTQLDNGTYIVKLTQGSRSLTSKLIINK